MSDAAQVLRAPREARPPSFWRGAALIAAKDLKVEWRTLETLTSMLLFSLIVLVIFSFAFELATVRQIGSSRLIPGVLWTVFSFTALIGFARSFQSERRHDTLTALQLSPLDPGSLFVGKTLANLVKISVLESLVLPLSAVFFDFDLISPLAPLIAVVALHTLGLAQLGTLAGAVAVRLGRGEALVATLLFPLSAPLFISAVTCTRAVLEGQALGAVSHWLWVAGGFDLLFFLVALLTFEYVLEE